MKNYLKYCIGVFLFIVVLPDATHAQAPKYSNEFLAVGVGARAHALAGAMVASVSDVTAGYWNPAGLLLTSKKYDLGLMHAEYFAGIAKYDYAGFADAIDERSSLAFTLLRFGVDDIPNTLELIDRDGNVRYDRIKTFSAADYALLVSYARRPSLPGLSLGGNVKIIYRHTGEFASAWGFGIDAAAQYRPGNWCFGAVVRDVTSTFNVWSFNNDLLEETFIVTGNELPEEVLELTLPRLILGAARRVPFTPRIGMMAELDAEITFDGKRNTLISTGTVSVDPRLGIEFNYMDMVFLRMGGANIQRIPGFDNSNALTVQPNLGIGISFLNFSIDYALTDIGDQSVALYSNIFSVRYTFRDKSPAAGK